MQTKIRIVSTSGNHQEIVDRINAIAEVQSCSEAVNGVAVVTMKEQLSDNEINAITKELGSSVGDIITKHFWHSTKQSEFMSMQEEIHKRDKRCFIGGEYYIYSECSWTSNYPSKWDDAICLGYGIIV